MMNQYRGKSRLFQDSIEEKRHYRLYKKGKFWVIAGMAVFSSGIIASQNETIVKADTTMTATTDATTTGIDAQQVTLGQTTDAKAQLSATDKLAQADTEVSTSESDSDKQAISADNYSNDAVADDQTSNDTAIDSESTTKNATQAISTTIESDEPADIKTTDQPKQTTNVSAEVVVNKGTNIATYSPQAGQSLVKQAMSLNSQIVDNATEGALLARQSETDSIPGDAALDALATHSVDELQSVTAAISDANSVAVTNLDSAVAKLNAAATIVNNMSQELVQAGVLLESDKKGVQTSVVANAQSAQEKFDLPDGVTTKLDDYGDLIVTTPSSEVYQSVLNSLAQQGLVTSFREVVDPDETVYSGDDVVEFSWQNKNIVPDTTSTAIGNNYRITGNNSDISLKLTITGNATDKISLTLPNMVGIELANGEPSKLSTTAGQVYTWVIPGTSGRQTYAVNIIFNGILISESTQTQQAIFKVAINGQSMPTATQTMTKTPTITSATIVGGSVAAINIIPKTTGESYVYKASYNVKGGPTDAESMSFLIPVPTSFKLNDALTAQINAESLNAFDSNAQVSYYKFSQPEGVGTPVIVTLDQSTVLRNTLYNSGLEDTFFAGEYVSTDSAPFDTTVGFSGYLTSQDGSQTYFGETDLGDGTFLDSNKQFYDNMLNSGTWLTEDPGAFKTQLVLSASKTSLEREVGSNPAYDILGNFSVDNASTTKVIPVISVSVPDELTTTGIVVPFSKKTNSAGKPMYYPDGESYQVTAVNKNGQQVTQLLTAGQSWNPLTGQIDTGGVLSVGAQLKNDSVISGYTIRYVKALAPDALAADPSAYLDINPSSFAVLGYINEMATIGRSSHVTVTGAAEDEQGNSLALSKPAVAQLYSLPTSSQLKPSFYVDYGSAEDRYSTNKVLVPGGTISTTISTGGYSTGQLTGLNLDGFSGSAYNLSTGITKLSNVTGYFEPVMYVTVPNQMTVKMTNGLPYTSPNTIKPKISVTRNNVGQSVLILDWSGTGYTTNTADKYTFTFEVNNIAVGSVDPTFGKFDENGTVSTEYVYSEDGGQTYKLWTKDQLAKKGVSTDGLQVVTSPIASGTSLVQWGVSQLGSTKPANSILTLADGTQIATYAPFYKSSSPSTYTILAAQGLLNTPLIQGTADMVTGATESGHNYPFVDFTGEGKSIKGLQQITIQEINNYSTDITNVWNITNLPQAGLVDPNDNQQRTANFTLKVSGPVELSDDTLNNVKSDSNQVYYATDSVRYSADGTALDFNDGTVWTIGSTNLPAELLTADQVTDWSSIESVLLRTDKLTSLNKIGYVANVYSPTSAQNIGKSTAVFSAIKSNVAASVLVSSATDNYYSVATVKYVDQDGKEINGYPALTSEVSLVNGNYAATGLFGLVGDSVPNTLLSIPGYVRTSVTGDTTFLADGSGVLVNTYQVDKAQLVADYIGLTDSASGDADAVTVSNTTTGTNTISFKTTDMDLAVGGLPYTVQVINDKGTVLKDALGNSAYTTLAAALAAQGTFDNLSDARGATQKFVVKYVLPADSGISIDGGTKVYDGDVATTPKTFTVRLPAGMKGLQTWDRAYFDTTGITSQNVGAYTIKFLGWDALISRNPGLDFTQVDRKLVTSIFNITPAPVTVTVQDVVKKYDGMSYTGKVQAQPGAIVPIKGEALDYTAFVKDGDLSHDINVGEYRDVVMLRNGDVTKNANYAITFVPGKLTIEPALVSDGNITIQSKTKFYDNDVATDPSTFDVILPINWNQPNWSVTDFTIDGTVASQNVGSYQVALSDTGLAKLQAANLNYQFSSKTVTNGVFRIDKAPVTIVAPTLTKTYDGEGYTDAVVPQSITGIPVKGVPLTYTLTNLTNDKQIGDYLITADLGDNPNYNIHVIPGKLTIVPISVKPGSVQIQSETKFYDNDVTTDPAIYQVTLTAGLVAPINRWTTDDFNLSGITSQNVGTYAVTLSDAGLAKLKAANIDYDFTGSAVSAGSLVINKTPVTIVAPTLTKTYDGQGYTNQVTVQSVTGMPTNGDQLNYTLTDLSNDVNAGTYVIDVTALVAANPNYDIHVRSGKLTIDKIKLTVPDNPNPTTPEENQQLATSVVMKGSTKIYDGNAITDPSQYDVLVPSNYQNLFKVPTTLNASDFDTTGISSQNVGHYFISLTASGIAKLQAANPNFNFDTTDVQNGVFTITPAAITIEAPTISKAFDGEPYGAITATVTGQPTKGVVPIYTLSDINDDTEVGTYPIAVIADSSANPNYTMTTINGALTITDDNYVLLVKYVDGAGTALVDPITETLNYKAGYTSEAKVIIGYYLTNIPAQPSGTMGKGNLTLTYVYAKIGHYEITPPAGESTTLQYPNDPDDPTQVVTPTTPIVPNIPGYVPVGPDGKTLVPFDPNDSNEGYLPPATPADPGQNTVIVYTPITSNPGGEVTPPTTDPKITPDIPVTPVTTPKAPIIPVATEDFDTVVPPTSEQSKVPETVVPVKKRIPKLLTDKTASKVYNFKSNLLSETISNAIVSDSDEYQPKATDTKAATLPQTSDEVSDTIKSAGILGLLGSVLSMIGLQRKKRKNE